MKRRIAVIVALLLLLSCMSACSTGGGSGSEFLLKSLQAEKQKLQGIIDEMQKTIDELEKQVDDLKNENQALKDHYNSEGTGPAHESSDESAELSGDSSQPAEPGTPEESSASSEPETTIKSEYEIEKVLTAFSGGTAMVTYYEENKSGDSSTKTRQYGLVDSEGCILWSVSITELNTFEGPIKMLDSSKGTYCIYSNKAGMILISSDGTIKFDSRRANEGTYYYYLGYGDGSFLAMLYETGFSENHAYLCEIDLNGNEIRRTEWVEEICSHEQCTYAGNDIFIVDSYESGSYFYDKSNGNLYLAADRFKIVPDASTIGDVKKYQIYFVPEENLAVLQGWNYNQLIGYELYDESYYFAVEIDRLHGSDPIDAAEIDAEKFQLKGTVLYGEGLFNYISSNSKFVSGVYDCQGNLIKAYPDSWNIVDASAFKNGYAKVWLRGADNNQYITVIDRNGNVQFDPVKVNSDEEAKQMEPYLDKDPHIVLVHLSKDKEYTQIEYDNGVISSKDSTVIEKEVREALRKDPSPILVYDSYTIKGWLTEDGILHETVFKVSH